MKQDLLYPELKRIENEIQVIKVMIMDQRIEKKNVSFRGMAKLKSSEKELDESIAEAKKSLLKSGF